MSETYTLYTRSNFDGLDCAALLKEIGLVDDVKFVHPKDVQDGKIQLGETDITASLPYCSGVYMAFDHHSSEAVRTKDVKETENKKEIVYTDEDGGNKPITEKVVMPVIEGAIITAQGAGNANVKSSIVSAVEAVTGLAVHKIQVFEMNSK